MRGFICGVYVIVLVVLSLWYGQPAFTHEEMIELGLPQSKHQKELYVRCAERRHNFNHIAVIE